MNIKDLIADTENIFETNLQLLESLKAYCLWANPFVADE